jgi:serine/threonine-protein kinase
VEDETRLQDDVTRLAGSKPPSAPGKAPSNPSGWLSSSGSIDHGRFAPGSVLEGRYRVLGLLGRGGMGEVYRADDLRLGQPVALKFLPADLQQDAVRLTQLHNEVRTARQVSHPSVCRVYDIGEADGQLYLSMEYVDGEDLSTSLRRIGRFPEDKAIDIARQLCAGLAAAHERGVLHRDLKPANVMLDGAGKVRIMDFSLATAGAADHTTAGTPAYMAPEQLQGRAATVQSDVFALGLVLYELFTGKRAFDAKTIPDLVSQHESGVVTLPTTVVTTIDPVIERAILRCLDRDPARRPASALAVSASLPGGDPLAMALAAGETPSPEMVAAAGGEAAALSTGQGVALVATAVVLLVLLSGLFDRTSVLARAPLAKSRPVLVDKAAELRQTFGYTSTIADMQSGYYYDSAYLNWAQRQGAGATNWRQISTGRPAAVGFWFRSGPSLLVPYDGDAPVSLEDPPMITPGMVRIDLDLQGRLTVFRAVPSMTSPATASPVNWDPLFQAAQIDRAAFTEAAPKILPRAYADEWKAWTGELPEAPGVPFRIEASGFRGRPTMFIVAGDWAFGEGIPQGRPSPVVRAIGVLMVASIPIGAALLARRNVRLGRGDRRGAFRAWAFAFGMGVMAWIVGPGHVSGLEEIDRMFASLATMLFWSAVLYVVYLALEPYVRRAWPTILITWSRLVSGRVRDPLVGHDLLVGTVAGLAVSLIDSAFVAGTRLAGQPEPRPLTLSLVPIEGWRSTFAWLLDNLPEALLNSMMVVLVLLVIRQGLMWLAGRLPGIAGRLVGSQGTMLVVTIVLFVILIKRNSLDAVNPIADITGTALLIVGLVGVTLRFGLFALIAAFFAMQVASEVPLTLDASKLYAGPAWFAGVVILALCATGHWLATREHPQVGRPFGNVKA